MSTRRSFLKTSGALIVSVGAAHVAGSFGADPFSLAAQAAGADLAYVGSPFIATTEAGAPPEYKQMILDSSAEDIVTTAAFTGIPGNYLAGSIRNAGLDPAALDGALAEAMDFGPDRKTRAWSGIWGAGQGIGAIDRILPAALLVDRLAGEYAAARRDLCGG